MNSDVVVFEVSTTGHGLSRTGTTGTMRVSCNWVIRRVALPLGESTSIVHLGWFLRQLFLFSLLRWVYLSEVCGVVTDIPQLYTDSFYSALWAPDELDERTIAICEPGGGLPAYFTPRGAG